MYIIIIIIIVWNDLTQKLLWAKSNEILLLFVKENRTVGFAFRLFMHS